MKNLIKNVIRSFKYNKMSIIGLIFLLFFGLGVFCVMSNTTSNINNEYTSLANSGKLHDFVASELYEIGSEEYAPYTKGYSFDWNNGWTNLTPYKALRPDPIQTKYITMNDIFGANMADITPDQMEEKTYFFILPEQTIAGSLEEEGSATWTFNIELDDQQSTGLYQHFAQLNKDSRLVKFTFSKTISWSDRAPTEVTNLQNVLSHIDAGQSLTEEDRTFLTTTNIFAQCYDEYLKFISKQTENIYSAMTTSDTPLALHIEEKYKDELDYRFFKSVNVTATKDNIFYKIIDSNPEDTIDKLVLFSDPSGRRGNNLYSVDDWAPYQSEIIIYKDEKCEEEYKPGTKIQDPSVPGIEITIPSDFNGVATMQLYDLEDIQEWDKQTQFVYTQMLQIRFKRMLAGDISDMSDPESFNQMLNDLAGKDLDQIKYWRSLIEGVIGTQDKLQIAYQNYIAEWYRANNENIAISSNGNVVFGWTESIAGTPQTCTISNWTNRFAVVNPQHLEKNNKQVLKPSTLNDFLPFKEWYQATFDSTPHGEINSDIAKQWFNSLTQEQFMFWIDPNKLTKLEDGSMSYDIPGKDEPVVVHKGTGKNQWNGIDKKYIAPCGGYDEIIWGCGLTPDFMYPIVDISRPTPNPSNECLVYCNNAGYYSIKLAFVNSTVEEYIIARFTSKVSTAKKETVINEINDWAQQNMIFPDNVKCAYLANDTNNILNSSGFRIAYIPNLVSVIQIVSIILCSFIGLLCLVICFVIIKRYVERNRINIGIMRANGIKKWKIGASLLPFALLPAIVGGIGAYFTGLGLQPIALSLFKNYWMLPTPLVHFDWMSFLFSIFIPFLVFSVITFGATLLVLRVNSTELMKAGSEFKTTSFSRFVKKPFKRFGVLTRFRVSLAFNSISRLVMMAAMSCLTMSSLVFAMTTFDKLSKSRITNSTQFDYSFNIELTTPTSSGSIYSVYDYSAKQPNDEDKNKGFGWTDPSQYIFNTSWNVTKTPASQKEMPDWFLVDGTDTYKELTKPYARNFNIDIPLYGEDPSYIDTVSQYGSLLLPNMSDSQGQQTDLLYLQNKLCSKLTLDHTIGVPGLASSNPWDIALALMPANSRNISADSYNNIINYAGQQINKANRIFFEKLEELTEIQFTEKHIEQGFVPTGFFSTITEEQIREAEAAAGKWCKMAENNSIIQPGYYNIYKPFFTLNEDGETYKLNDSADDILWLWQAFNPNFISLIKTMYSDQTIMEKEYPITYGNIPLNWNKTEQDKKDETYTYIAGNITNLSNHHKFDSSTEIKIEGIADNSKYIKLTDSQGHDLNKYLIDNNYIRSLNAQDTTPIIINAYAAHKYGLKVKDQITINVSNTVDRYEQQLHPENKYDNQKVFTVIGISQGTNNATFYTSQERANKILGLPDGKSWNKTHKYMMWTDPEGNTWPEWDTTSLPKIADLAWNNDKEISIYKFNTSEKKWELDRNEDKLSGIQFQSTPIGFNGIYTENKEGKPITNGVSLYSYTGLYPSTSVYKSSGNNKFKDLLMVNNNLAIANMLSCINNQTYYEANSNYLSGIITDKQYEVEIDKFIAEIVKTYGDTTMITAICGAMDVAASDLIYNNLVSTFNLAETTIMSIIIPITIIIVAIISNLIIVDSKKMAAMMKALGYSDAKNLMSILALFVPTIIFGLLLSIPVSFGLTLAYQSTIFNTANILVDVTQKWWYYAVGIAGIGAILFGTYAIGFVSLKKDRLVDQIK